MLICNTCSQEDMRLRSQPPTSSHACGKRTAEFSWHFHVWPTQRSPIEDAVFSACDEECWCSELLQLKNVSPALHKSQARNKSHVHCTDHRHAANPMSTAQITGTQHVTCHMSTTQIMGTQGVPCPLHKSQARSMSHVHCTDHRHRCVGNPIFIYYRKISNSRLWRQVQGDQFLMLQKILTTSQP